MSESKLAIETPKVDLEAHAEKVNATPRPVWETPTLEDVSEQVMAQPYIRFT